MTNHNPERHGGNSSRNLAFLPLHRDRRNRSRVFGYASRNKGFRPRAARGAAGSILRRKKPHRQTRNEPAAEAVRSAAR